MMENDDFLLWRHLTMTRAVFKHFERLLETVEDAIHEEHVLLGSDSLRGRLVGQREMIRAVLDTEFDDIVEEEKGHVYN